MDLDGTGKADITTGIAFFDHMLTAFCVHGFFDLKIIATGDLAVDFHHTVEDVGLVLGHEALSRVTIDLSNRPYLVYHFPKNLRSGTAFDVFLAKEFFQAFSIKGGFNLHINGFYGTNEHHVLESIFKALGRSLHQATRMNEKIAGILSSKGSL